jgi:putative protease
MDKRHVPELLLPCGDMDALLGAISAGADAVYFGMDIFNARIRANNFTLDNVSEAISLCHAHNIKVFVTLNIGIYEKEIPLLLEYVSRLWEAGADALIISDLGIISLVREKFPDFEIHASTQATVHNLDGVKKLSEMGASRVVLARELDKKNMAYIAKGKTAELEAFVHGAHCMSVSGQCLMSYLLGGRSGNRGECAQPCRLPYSIMKKQSYLLSLKDMSLSSHLTELSEMGIDSLKVEGRMKSEDYVYGVGKIYRRLLDSEKNANYDDLATLSALFSRQGFTDGYFERKIGASMLGVRSDENKEQSKQAKTEIPPIKKVKIDAHIVLRAGEKATLTLKNGEKEVTVHGDIVEIARNAPMSSEDIIKNLSKLGQTPFEMGNVTVDKDESIIIRVSSLNALRRDGVLALLSLDREKIEAEYIPSEIKSPSKIRTAFFLNPNEIPEDLSYFDRVYVYLDRYDSSLDGINGICMPPVIFDSEWDEIEKMLENAKKCGIKYALVSNIGQIERVKKHGFIIQASHRFNAFNRPCVEVLHKNGFDKVIMSPELTLARLSDFKGESVIVYGKLPMMTVHKCLLKDTCGCKIAKNFEKDNVSCRSRTYMVDRTGASFFVSGAYAHLNVIFNSVPIYMADKIDTLSAFSHHFIFTDEKREDCEKIIEAYKKRLPTSAKIRRIK